MSSKEHTALTTDSNSLAQRSTVLTLAIVCGLAVAKRTRLFSWYLYLNTLGLRLKVFVKVSFFNVDAKRLTAGYHSRRRVHREKKKTLNPSVLTYIWGLWQWNGVCALGFFLLAVAFITHFSVHKRKSPVV